MPRPAPRPHHATTPEGQNTSRPPPSRLRDHGVEKLDVAAAPSVAQRLLLARRVRAALEDDDPGGDPGDTLSC